MTGRVQEPGGRDELAAVLRGVGLTDKPSEYDSDIHSWRCSYPHIYGPCDCFAGLVADLAALVAEAEQRGAARGWVSSRREEKIFTLVGIACVLILMALLVLSVLMGSAP